MKAARGLVSGLLLASIPAAGLANDVPERIFEISPYVGVFVPDGNTNYKSASPLLGLRGVLNNSARWGIEGYVGYSPRQAQSYKTGMLDSYTPFIVVDPVGDPIGVVYTNLQTTETSAESGSDILMFGGSAFYHFSEKPVRPFLSLGAGFIDDISGGSGEGEPGSNYSHPYGDIGGGVKIYRSGGWNIRLEVHDLISHQDDLARPNPLAALNAADFDFLSGGGTDGVLGTEPYDPDEHNGKRWLHNWTISASLSMPFGYVYKDGDGDKVEDRFDLEPTTAPNVVVDAQGRGIDSDRDGVFDGIDQCDNTQAGATVDLAGCPSDSDKDGILDGIDTCPDTPPGATVDPTGCPSDADGDGVPNGVDTCPDTPLGTPIDEKGCAKNSVEEMLLRGDRVALSGVEFEPGSAEIDPLSYNGLNKVGPVIEHWTKHPETPRTVEVTVYPTREEAGRELAQARADALRTYLIQRFSEIDPAKFAARGASSAPTGPGTEAARVDLRMLP
jgi:hypothetical protein